MNKLQLSLDKVLKLTNVLKKDINPKEFEDFTKEVEFMENQIKVKGAIPKGPLVQYSNGIVNAEGEWEVEVKFLCQANNFIHNVDQPYSMESVLRVPNCMYCRYIGPEYKLKFAYDKINLEAFENDIELKGDNYTIFVAQNEEEDTIVADVFMPRADSEN